MNTAKMPIARGEARLIDHARVGSLFASIQTSRAMSGASDERLTAKSRFAARA